MAPDIIPAAQGRHANNLLGAIQLCGVVVCLALAVYEPQLKYVLLGIGAILLFVFYAGRLELHRIDGIVKSIQGKRDSRKQYAEGIHGDSSVRFFIGAPPSINYSVLVDGDRALQKADDLRDFVNQAMRQEGIKGYRLLISSEAITLSKPFITAFQLRVDEAERIYSILDGARRRFLNAHRMDAQPPSPFDG